jgi:hypothetical protein
MSNVAELKLPEPSAAHRRLDVFVGRWHGKGQSYADGQQADDPIASAVPWTSDESYEWLPGGFFLLHRWDAMAGKRAFQGTEILGYDVTPGRYFTRLFDSAGFHPEYRAEVAGNVWTFSEPQTRATVTVGHDGSSMNTDWEWKNGGSAWLPLCARVATRVS